MFPKSLAQGGQEATVRVRPVLQVMVLSVRVRISAGVGVRIRG